MDGTLKEFDFATNERFSRAPMPTTKSGFATVSAKDKIYVIGGEHTRLFGECYFLTTIEEYDVLSKEQSSRFMHLISKLLVKFEFVLLGQ